jgi:hypothetical protein
MGEGAGCVKSSSHFIFRIGEEIAANPPYCPLGMFAKLAFGRVDQLGFCKLLRLCLNLDTQS